MNERNRRSRTGWTDVRWSRFGERLRAKEEVPTPVAQGGMMQEAGISWTSRADRRRKNGAALGASCSPGLKPVLTHLLTHLLTAVALEHLRGRGSWGCPASTAGLAGSGL